MIDSEHEHIVRLINDYSDHITGNLSRDKQLKAYSEIVDCLSAHFIKEEQIMASHKYDNLEAHIKAHGGLFEKLTHMTFLIENLDDGAASMILEFLKTWFFNHVMILDVEFCQSISNSDSSSR